MSKSTCSVEDCGRPALARGLCNTHYSHARRERLTDACSIEECDRPIRSRSWCKTHYERWLEYGDPLMGEPIQMQAPRGAAYKPWFWSVLKPNGDCLDWPYGTYGKDGYGSTKCPDAPISKAHRIAWFYTNGPIPEDMHVLHACDRPICCNPAHLWLGTNEDNIRDRNAKRRQARGERSGRAKLTEDGVREIRRQAELGVSGNVLAGMYGVHHSTIQDVLHGKSWSDDD